MCYYECIVFSCQDWKWGNFKQHCNKEYRIGETCGMKLVYQSLPQNHKCKLCEKIDTKWRRRESEADRVRRWTVEKRCPASVEKSMVIINQLDREITELQAERTQRWQAIGGQSRRG
jgi:hypothetical protein